MWLVVTSWADRVTAVKQWMLIPNGVQKRVEVILTGNIPGVVVVFTAVRCSQHARDGRGESLGCKIYYVAWGGAGKCGWENQLVSPNVFRVLDNLGKGRVFKTNVQWGRCSLVKSRVPLFLRPTAFIHQIVLRTCHTVMKMICTTMFHITWCQHLRV